MRFRTVILASVPLALGLTGCGEAAAVAPAMPAAPRRAASSGEQPPRAAVELVDPEALAQVLELVLEAPPPIDSAEPELQTAPVAPQPVALHGEPNEQGVKVKRVPLARDRKGKVIGRGPTKANRPSVSQGPRTSKFTTPSRGRKTPKPGGGRGKKKAAAEAEAADQDPRR